MSDEFDKKFYEGFDPEEAGDDWDGTEEECKFVKLIDDTESSKVKFSGFYATYDSGLSHVYWICNFDESYESVPHPKLLGCIKEYLIWSSHRIKELEAKLAISNLFSEDNKENE